MGWTSFKTKKSELIDRLVNEKFVHCDVIDTSVKGNLIFQLLKSKTDEKVSINVTKVESFGNGEWGYKSLSECSGPYWGFDCPKKFLKASTDMSEYAVEYRNRCMEHQTKKLNVKKVELAKGMKFIHDGEIYTLCRAYNTTASQWVAQNEHSTYRFKKEYIINNLIK